MEFHMYAQTACTVADCITTLLSRKAKLKGENPPPAKLYISTFSHKAHWMGVHQISFFVCLSFCLPPTFSPIPVSGFQVSVSLTFIFSFDSASLSVLVHLSLTFFHLPSLCFLPIRLPRCLYVCLSACISACPCIQSVCLPPPCLSYLSCLCSSTRRHNTHPIMI